VLCHPFYSNVSARPLALILLLIFATVLHWLEILVSHSIFVHYHCGHIKKPLLEENYMETKSNFPCSSTKQPFIKLTQTQFQLQQVANIAKVQIFKNINFHIPGFSRIQSCHAPLHLMKIYATTGNTQSSSAFGASASE
jgi:hypothetical protein